MKRKRNILVVIAIYIILLFCGIKLYLPGDEFNADDIVRDNNGNIYATGDVDGSIYVYKMDANGNVLELYRCKKEYTEVENFCRYNDNRLYVGQAWYEDGKQHFSIWVKEASDKRFKSVWKNAFDNDVKITDIHIEHDDIRVIGVEQQTEDILQYIYQDGKEKLVNYDNKKGFLPTAVYWGNGGLYALSQDNHVYYIDLSSNMYTINIDDVVLLLTDENGLYYQKRDSSALTYIFYDGLGGYIYDDLGDVWNIQHSSIAQNSAVLLFKDGEDRLLIVGQDGASKTYIDSFKLSIDQIAMEGIIPFVIVTLMYIIVIVTISLFFILIWKKKRLMYQTMAALIAFSGVWLLVTLVSISRYEAYHKVLDRQLYADTCMKIQKGRLQDNPSIYRLNYDSYVGSEQQKIVEDILTNYNTRNTWQSFFTRVEIVYGYDNPQFIFSEEAAYGRRADTFYNAEAIERIRECISTGDNQSFADKIDAISYAIAITQIDSESRQLCLVSRVPISGADTDNENLLLLYIIAISGWIVIMLLIAIFLKRKWRPAEMLVAQMEKVSRGDYRLDRRKVPNNEFGTMWAEMERMCSYLQNQYNKNSEILKYIYQFAPKNFEKLFSKEKLQDIEIGETVQISATMGMISIMDKDTLLTGKVQRQYVQYVNQLMEILFSQSESELAIFLQNGSNLENVKVIFKEDGNSAVTAVKYSLECIETLLGKTETKYDTKPFILLHTSQFSCGLAGGSKQVYPYVTSLEMETLNLYIDKLKRSGMRMVVTQNTWHQIEKQVNGRCIGYVTSKDGEYTFNLYEILDACSQLQKLNKIKNITNFNKALKLFYDNKLYPARSAFADILKECPDDGIARWYTFACDEMLGREDNSDARYDLFWELM